MPGQLRWNTDDFSWLSSSDIKFVIEGEDEISQYSMRATGKSSDTTQSSNVSITAPENNVYIFKASTVTMRK